MRIFISYLSTNIFSLTKLSIPIFINAVLSATAIQVTALINLHTE